MKRIMMFYLFATLVVAMCSCERNDTTPPDNGENPGETPGGGSPALNGFDGNGASLALFSVSESQKVRFSRGNLQYQASTGTWRFAECQYGYVGEYNSNISSENSGWIDLFGWGTSGWNGGAVAWQPYSSSINASDYWPGGSQSNDLAGSCVEADWGWHNAVKNGGNKTHMWRVLTSAEWEYLLRGRTDAVSKCGAAAVGNVVGMVILPDSWTAPDSLSFVGSFASGLFNTYNEEEWKRMEANGAVFLPAAGRRDGVDVSDVGISGTYWSSTHSNENNVLGVTFYSNVLGSANSLNRSRGYSVRPVTE